MWIKVFSRVSSIDSDQVASDLGKYRKAGRNDNGPILSCQGLFLVRHLRYVVARDDKPIVVVQIVRPLLVAFLPSLAFLAGCAEATASKSGLPNLA